MKRFKEIISAILVVAVLGMVFYLVYQHVNTKTHRDLAKRIMELSPKGGPPETIDGLRKAIALYEDQIERNVREGAQTGVYWKILAIRLADKKMHNDALKAFERAIYYNTEDPTIYYLTGVSAASAAKSIIGFSTGDQKEKDKLYKLSENSYLRAMDIDITYTKPMYGIAILYIFELDRPQDAIPYLERYLKISGSDISAMFVLARAYYSTEKYSEAAELYDKIISRTKDKKIKEEAQNNKDMVQGLIYE